LAEYLHTDNLGTIKQLIETIPEAPNDGAWYARESQTWGRINAPSWATGRTWTSQQSAANSYWNSVTYGNGLFVVVSGLGNQVMTSPDGIMWILQ